jgi:hypothetical protein
MRRVLVVVTARVEAEELSPPLQGRFGRDAQVRILRPQPSTEPDGRVATGPDSVQAIDDALREFDADVVVVVTRMSDEASWRETGTVESARDHFDVPITHLLVA